MTQYHYWATIFVFCLTYWGMAYGKFPGLKTDRAGIALAGAAAMLALGVIGMEDAAHSVDLHTLALLLGMMVVVASLQIGGLFDVLTHATARLNPGPFQLLAAVILLSGTLSALLVNDVVCVAFTPLVVSLCQTLKKPAIPYLIGLATASNIGSAATQTGNPQNMIIASLSKISYADFFVNLAPIAFAGLVLNFLIVSMIYWRQLSQARIKSPSELETMPAVEVSIPHVEPAVQRLIITQRSVKHRHYLIRSLAITLVTVVLFFVGCPLPIVALSAAGLTLLSAVRPEKFYRHVDWPLLVMFAGLFIVVRAFEVNIVRTWDLPSMLQGVQHPLVVVSLLSVFLSNLVSNVPAVLLFRSLIPELADPQTAWLMLSVSSTFAGNLTLLGSVANLIVVESARKRGVFVSFFEYLKVGCLLTVLSVAMATFWLIMAR